MMTAQQTFHQAPQKPSQHSNDATIELGRKGPSLGKRKAMDDLETVEDAHRMETYAQETSRKRSDYRATPQKAPPPPASQAAGNNVEPRQLLAQLSPRHVPLPESPSHARLSENLTTLEPTDETTTNKVLPSKHGNSMHYQQQSMSRHLSETTPTTIPHTPEVVRVNINVSEEVNQASLSEAEDASQAQGSGNESKSPTTPTTDNRRRRSTRQRS